MSECCVVCEGVEGVLMYFDVDNDGVVLCYDCLDDVYFRCENCGCVGDDIGEFSVIGYDDERVYVCSDCVMRGDVG